LLGQPMQQNAGIKPAAESDQDWAGNWRHWQWQWIPGHAPNLQAVS
jgi:hypothetical protein